MVPSQVKAWLKKPMRFLMIAGIIAVFGTFHISAVSADTTKKPNIQTLQESLNFFGFSAGEPDGIWGPQSKAALLRAEQCLRPIYGASNDQHSKTFLTDAHAYFKTSATSGSCLLLKTYARQSYECPSHEWSPVLMCTTKDRPMRASLCVQSTTIRFAFGAPNQMPDHLTYRPTLESYTPWVETGTGRERAILVSSENTAVRLFARSKFNKKQIETGIDLIENNTLVETIACEPHESQSAFNAIEQELSLAGICWNEAPQEWGTCTKEGGWARYVSGPVFPMEAYQLGEFSAPCDMAEGEEQAIAAYEFGLYVQELVRSEDLASLYDNIHGALIKGPTKSDALEHGFKHFFSDKWVETLLNIEPQCTPIGTRGYMLGRGLIWFDMIQDKTQEGTKNKWSIISINNDIEP